jgi:DNA-binding protein YbaB
VSDPLFEQVERDRVRLAAMDAQFEELQALSTRGSAIQSTIDEMRVSLWSPGREVRVTVASSGLLEHVEYSARALSVSAEALAATTMKTLRQAIAEVQSRIDDLTLGEDADELSTAVAAEYHTAFATSLAELHSGDIGFR